VERRGRTARLREDFEAVVLRRKAERVRWMAPLRGRGKVKALLDHGPKNSKG
jgi:hypothetical protein